MSYNRYIYLAAILIGMGIMTIGLSDGHWVPKLLANTNDPQGIELPSKVFLPIVLKPLVVNTTADGADWNPGDGRCQIMPDHNICTLRAAIQETNAQPGPDVILVPAGKYVLTVLGVEEDGAETGDLDITDDLAIIGDSATTTLVDGNQIDRIFHSLGSNKVFISNITVMNGEASGNYGGGGIYNSRDQDYYVGHLTLSNVTVDNNMATGSGGGWNYSGGGILSDGPLTITHSIISNNETVNGHGGGIRSNSTLSLHDTTIFGNVAARYGGGIWASRIILTDSILDNNAIKEEASTSEGAGLYITISATLEACTISNNVLHNGKGGGIFISGNASATITHCSVLTNAILSQGSNSGTRGGGIYSESNQAIIIEDTTIEGNISDYSGGGLYHDPLFSGQMYLNRVTLRQNIARSQGAGIYNNSEMYLTNVTLSGNQAVGRLNQEGGGIFHDGSLLSITNSTIAGNEARYGGGIYRSSGNVLLENTILANNIAAEPINPGEPNTHNCSGIITSAGHNLEDGVDCDLISIDDLSDIDPLLLPLTIGARGTRVYPIHMDSPAIDTGDNSVCPKIDQRGETRPFDGNNDGNAVCDIGAYEYP